MGQAEATEIVDPLIGQVIANRYEIVRLINRGGMGAVYEVCHRNLNRSFAMKTLTPDLVGDPEALARFRREAEIVATLRHPNIIDVVDWDTLYDGSPCMVMEMLRGEDLLDYLDRRGPLPWRDIARIGDEILSALVVAHNAGVIHRDLKPENIFIHVDDSGGEHAMLLDFGVSKLHHSRTLSGTGTRLLGTPTYMAPEQAAGHRLAIGPATDVWAVGAILYEMATGREAFSANTLPSLLYRICNQDPTPIRDLRPGVPPRFEELIGRTLSREPDTRIQTAFELRSGLRSALRRRYLRALRRRNRLELVEHTASDEQTFSSHGGSRLGSHTECVFGVVPIAESETVVQPAPCAPLVAPSSSTCATTIARGTRPGIRIRPPIGPRRRRDPAVLLAGVLSVIALVLLAAWLSPPEVSEHWPPAPVAPSALPAAEPAGAPAPAPAPEPAPDPEPEQIIEADPLVIDIVEPEQPEPEPAADDAEPEATPQPEQTPAPVRRPGKRPGPAKEDHPKRKKPNRHPPSPIPAPTPVPAPASLPKTPTGSNLKHWSKQLKNAARRCAKDTHTNGTISLTMQIAPSGSVTEARVSDVGPEFEACLVGAAFRAKFEPSREGITHAARFVVWTKQ